MKKEIIIVGLSILMHPFAIGAQYSSIYGKVSYELSLVPVDSVRIELLDSLDGVVKSVNSDVDGKYFFDNVKEGEYKLHIEIVGRMDHLFMGVRVDGVSNIEFDLKIKDPCQNEKYSRKCPYCGSIKRVLKISPGTIVSLNFGDNISAAKRHERKIRSKGYRTYVNEEGEEEVIAVRIPEEEEKFWDYCHDWFCTRCKKVF